MAYKIVPTWNGGWTTTEFDTREDFRDFLVPLFLEPGTYEFDDVSSSIFNQEGRKFQKQGYYCSAPIKTKDFITYWDDQKNKCRNGIIVISGQKTWYITREYYMWLNFLPIYDKEEKRFDFAKIRDAQYHMALYESLAELHWKHAIILKKRQIASSYFHMAKFINQWAFEEGAVLKMGASLKDYINEKGSWKFLTEYRNFLNEHTAWYRPAEPDKVGSWQQQIKVRMGGRDTYKGLKSTINIYSFEKDPTHGVGGPVTYFFHEEAGIAPKMDDTYGFMKPALKSGHMITGQFIAAGSVGDLDQCEPMKEYIMHPEENGFYGVQTTLIDKDGTPGITGLFIPEQWSMPPYIDKYGNSLVTEALEALEKEFEKLKRELEPAAYQLTISQSPRNIEEAFATRKVSVFPPHHIAKQAQRIADKVYPYELLELEYDATNKIVAKESGKLPINEFPVKRNSENKESVLVVWERPVKDPKFGMYYASVDPVSEGKSTTSDSLCSIIVYKTAIQVTKDDGFGKVENFIEHDKIVATWCGRFDDLMKTHERLEKIIEWYNAWTIVENNVSLFIQYMISRHKQRYLVPKDQILFLKDLGSNSTVYQTYGWKNTGVLFKQHLLSYGIQFVMEEIDQEVGEDGKIYKTTYGVERIPDPMIIKEMQAYHEGLNVDRLVTFCSLVAFAKVQQSNRGMMKRVEYTSENLENSQKSYKLKVSPFNNIGRSRSSFEMKRSRSAFKNMR